MTLTEQEQQSPSSTSTSTDASTSSLSNSSNYNGDVRNNLNRSHFRTHSHPLTLLDHDLHDLSTSTSTTNSSLTDALNLDFVNIPVTDGSTKVTPGSIPPSVMQKYLDTSSQNQVDISDILVDLDLDFPHRHKSEVAQVLDNFNALLERIELNDQQELTCDLTDSRFVSPSSSGGSGGSSQRIKNSVEAFAELLLRGEEAEDEDLLIVVEGEGEVAEGLVTETEECEECDLDDLEMQEMDDLCPEVMEDFEGYESDRPMVRASMRKLRLVRLKPLQETVKEEDPVISAPVIIEGQGSPEETSASSSNGSELFSIVVVSEQTPSNSGSDNVTSSSGGGGQGSSSPILEETATLSANSAPGTAAVPSQSTPTPESSPVHSSNATTTTPTNSSPNSIPSTPTNTNTNTTTPPNPPPTARRRPGVPIGRWPHRLSSVLALVGCTLGLNNICRFGLLSVQYGANFVVQFLFLSALLGVPLLTFHMSIGQYLNAGIVNMWKISPIFQGIGVGLMISQALVGLYTAVGVSWMLIYFRDSFVTRGDQYRWGKCVREFRECDPYQSAGYNESAELSETVPDYFNGVVLQRSSPDYPNSVYVPNSLKFTVAFNLAVVWMLIFVSLSKGLKSYGKVVHGFVLAPVAALFVLTFKMVGIVDTSATLFGQTAWSEFFFNTQTWVVAAREVFFTWGLLGVCVMQVTAHNRHAHPLKSDAIIVVMVTTVVLLLSAFIGNTCLSVITATYPSTPYTPTSTPIPVSMSNPFLHHYSYVPSSFESDRTYKFLSSKGHELPDLLSFNYNHNPLLMGVRIQRPDIKGDATYSGYQVLRLATELFPTTMAILSPSGLSPFWTVLFYFTLVLFGIAQQLAIWHSVIKGIIAIKYKVLKSWETTITFFVCGLGFVLGLPLCTETGIFVTYFLDFAIGSGWWIMILYLLELVAVFIVRGAPYCGENIVTVLITGPGRLARAFAPLVSFIWNVIMPVALLVLSIASFKSGNIRELYDWNPHRGYVFWPSWTREVGSLLQLLPILAVPFVAIIQSCRYLSNGPSDLFDRMQQLYRPSTRFGSSGSSRDASSRSAGGRSEDPPPKYTPPPSYSTATGAKIARFLRNSFRRSLRRMGSPAGPSTSNSLPPPPNYASVILEINAQRATQQSCAVDANSDLILINGGALMLPPPLYEEATQQQNQKLADLSLLGAVGGEVDKFSSKAQSHSLGRSLGLGLASENSRASLRRIASDITSRDLARMLRASFRRPEAANQPANIEVPIPPSTFSKGSLEKIDYDLELLRGQRSQGSRDDSRGQRSEGSRGHYLEEPSTSNNSFDLLGFNRSRNRNSNDSQLALISDNYSYNDHIGLDLDLRPSTSTSGQGQHRSLVSVLVPPSSNNISTIQLHHSDYSEA